MKKIIILVMAIVLFASNIFIAQDVNAKRITKQGVYTNTQKRVKIKFLSNKIIVKGPLKYGKKLTYIDNKYKKIGKAKRTFRITKNTKYYQSTMYVGKYRKISKKLAKSFMKDISDEPTGLYFSMFVKNRKVYKIIFGI